MTPKGKGNMMVAIAFIIGVAICAIAYYYTNYVL